MWLVSFRPNKILSLFLYLHAFILVQDDQLIGEHLGYQDSMETMLLLV